MKIYNLFYSIKWLYMKFFIISLILIFLVGHAHAIRIKDISDIEGVRQNQLVGYGLIVGLNGTGDSKNSTFTIQSMTSMLEKMGITLEPDDISVDNVAAVMATANLPPFAKAGSRIDVLVSSIGDSENLQGGTLLMTPLRAADGKVYAVAQGPVSTGGFSIKGSGGGGIQKNFPTVGRVVRGALIERSVQINFNQKKTLSLTLHHPDFTTVSRVADVINAAFDDNPAQTQDAGTIEVKVSEKYLGNIVKLVTLIERLSVITDEVAKVVINERTGTVVMGDNVRISTIAIAHGNLSIQIKESENVSQPSPFAQGDTVVTPETEIMVQEEANKLVLMESGVSIGELVRALNALGVTPRDLIAIFQSIKAANALKAKLEII